jgi:hypothetical protein
MTANKQPHILNASSNLVGIALVLVTGLKLTKASDTTWCDEISVCCAIAFMASCVTSYLSLRADNRLAAAYERAADYLFMGGMFSLFFAVTGFAYDYL